MRDEALVVVKSNSPVVSRSSLPTAVPAEALQLDGQRREQNIKDRPDAFRVRPVHPPPAGLWSINTRVRHASDTNFPSSFTTLFSTDTGASGSVTSRESTTTRP